MSGDRTYIDEDDLAALGDAAPEPEGPRFRVDDELARGGLGRVHRGWDTRLDREIAVKTLLAPSGSAAVRFERELRLTARLQHPNIVPVYDGGRDDQGLPFLAMRLVHGRSLAAAIDACGALGERLELLPHVIDACNAVAYAHSQRIAHRDLKPDNILVGDFGETVVIDWGLAKDLDAVDEPATAEEGGTASGGGSQASLTRVGAVVGTPAYMPPEQAAGHPVDEKADVYALGAVLYHTLAGHRPYADAADVLGAVLDGPPVPLGQTAAGIPRDLLAVVGKAMAREPGARYADARSLAAELERFQAGRFVSAYDYTPAERLAHFVRRYPIPVGLTALLVVGTLVGILLLGRANRIAEDRRAAAEHAEQQISALRDQEREQLDALTLEQARLVMTTDPARSLQLLATLSEARPFDGAVRTVASAAWSQQPPLRLDAPEGGWVREIAADAKGVAVAWGRVVHLYDADLELGQRVAFSGPIDGLAMRDGVAWVCSEGRLSHVRIGEAPVWVESVGEGGEGCRSLWLSGDGWVVGTETGAAMLDGDGALRFSRTFDRPRLFVPETGPEGDAVWFFTGYRHVELFDSRTGASLGQADFGGQAYRRVPAPVGRRIALLGSGAETLMVLEHDGRGFRRTGIQVDTAWLAAGAWLGPDRMVVGGEEQRVFVVDVPRRRVVQTVDVRGAPVQILSLGPDRAAVTTDRGQVGILEATTDGVQLVPLGGAEVPLTLLEAGPNGRIVAAGDEVVLVQEPRRGEGRAVFHCDRGPVYHVEAAPGDEVLVASQCGMARIGGDGAVTRLTDATAKRIAVCGGVAWVAEATRIVSERGVVALTAGVTSTACKADGTRLGVVEGDGGVLVLDTASGAEVFRGRVDARELVRRVFWDGDDLVVPANVVWKLADGSSELVAIAHLSDAVSASGYLGGEIAFALFNGDVVSVRGEPLGNVPRLAVVASEAGDGLVLGDFDGNISLFRTRGGPVESLHGHRQYVTFLAPGPEGRWLASGGWDNAVWLWDLSIVPASGRPLEGHDAAVMTGAWATDGRLYTGDRGGTVRVWTDPFALEPARLRRQVEALAAALAAGRPLPEPDSVP
ncbi:MAG: protein kinase [Alphaproteobacteria bacterium]|nr:protein kinase [Alphaproteobacteria bacterium]